MTIYMGDWSGSLQGCEIDEEGWGLFISQPIYLYVTVVHGFFVSVSVSVCIRVQIFHLHPLHDIHTHIIRRL